MGNLIVVKLKGDIESEGELTLAMRELSSLCENTEVKLVSYDDVIAHLNGHATAKDIKGRFLIADVSINVNVTQQLSRLAYGAWFLDEKQNKIIPQQAFIENSVAEAAGTQDKERSSRRSREYLSHGIHKYKAKFFPRFSRALINICCSKQSASVLDPFCGSGTTGLEASLMGLKAICSDIDPLSCLISYNKIHFPEISFSVLETLDNALKLSTNSKQGDFLETDNELQKSKYKIPEFLRVKLEPSVVADIERDVCELSNRLLIIEDEKARSIGKLLISHAVSTKIALRWMGTGDNRFALEIGSRDLLSVARGHLKRLKSNHPVSLGIRLPPHVIAAMEEAEIIPASADSLPFTDNSIDAVVTSPPYLPASSGRETYLRSRAPGIIALELLSEKEIHELDANQIVGSVLRKEQEGERDLKLPREIMELVNWMQPQRARTAKAEPTLVYFQDLRRIGKEIHRVLKPNGAAALVVATSHSFYELVSREVVKRLPLAKVLAELFTDSQYGVGFNAVEFIDIELPKMDFIARPASRHSYSETALIFRK